MKKHPLARTYLGPSPAGAVFSPCRTWRYSLRRRWVDPDMFDTLGYNERPSHDPLALVAFVGLNPSTADEWEDDPTVRRCIDFAKRWGFGGMVMLNAFAMRSTNPDELRRVRFDPVGPENDVTIARIARIVRQVICCWGNHGAYHRRDRRVKEVIRRATRQVYHLGLTMSGQPKHPLYLRRDTERVFWPPARRHGHDR